MLRRLQQVDEAERCLRRAIELGPNRDGCWVNLGLVLLETARIHEATDHLRLGSERFGQSLAAQQKWAYALLHDDRATADDLLTAHRRWGAIVESAVRPSGPGFPVDRDPDRVLRVAYLSPDLHQHSVAYFLEPLMQAHDRERVEVYAFDTGLVHDDTTTRLQGVADHWRDLERARDRDLVERVNHDRIDVLVELTGHYSNNRLASMARKLTPVQVTYLGYPATTGLTRIDARLVDAHTDPIDPERPDPATENLVRLDPCFLCYSAPPKAPEHNPVPPVARGEPFTFGSFNNLKKVGPWVLDAWADILKRCDGARLLLKGRGYDDPGVRERLAGEFEARGVDTERVRMIARTSGLEEHFAMYHEVDCALDTFPYNGTTTTCEAAWMGVPTLTTRGAHHAARVGVSLKAVMGLDDFTLDTPDALVDRAAQLFKDPSRLVELRPGLRESMRNGPLMDAPAFARRIEDAYRTLWHAYLDATAKSP
jgi:protein O-GlcNAc transferase